MLCNGINTIDVDADEFDDNVDEDEADDEDDK